MSADGPAQCPALLPVRIAGSHSWARSISISPPPTSCRLYFATRQ